MTETSAYNYCALPLAPYACRPDMSRGRVYAEPESRYRTGFQRDRDRIIHSAAFRRLKYKTQVFVYHEGDNYRTRLTHTLEVAQIARTIARALMTNEDLAEAVALAHDLGHPPFAHVGEDVLKACMKDVFRGRLADARSQGRMSCAIARLPRAGEEDADDLLTPSGLRREQKNRASLRRSASRCRIGA